MSRRDARAVGVLWMVFVTAGFASCGGDTETADGGGAGKAPSHAAGMSTSAAGSESDAGANPGGRSTTLGGTGGVSEAGQGGAGGVSEVGQGGVSVAGQGGAGGALDALCSPEAGARSYWWNSTTQSCEDCPAMATIECTEIEAGSSYDVDSSILTVHLPPGRMRPASALIEADFSYANDDPGQYADVNAIVAGDTLTFDFSAYEGSGLSYLGGYFSLHDSCGAGVRIHAIGAGFGPAILIDVDGDGTTAGEPRIDCGYTN